MPQAAAGEDAPIPISELLDNLISESDGSGRPFTRDVKGREAELRSAIEARLDALEDGTDPYSAQDPAGSRQIAEGGVIYQLGVYANDLGDEEFARSVWRRCIKMVMARDLDPWSQAAITDVFSKVATTQDLPLLREIEADTSMHWAITRTASQAITRLEEDEGENRALRDDEVLPVDAVEGDHALTSPSRSVDDQGRPVIAFVIAGFVTISFLVAIYVWRRKP